MSKVLIDARESGTSTGRYIDKLIENLYIIEPKGDFRVLTKKDRVEAVKKLAPGYKVTESNHKEFTFAEQFKFVWQLYGIKNEIVHFGMTHQPVLYFGKVVTTIHDLTTVRFRNPSKNFVIFKFKQFVYKLVIRWVAKKSRAIIVPSKFVKDDLIKFTKIEPDKIHITYEAADKIKVKSEPLATLKDREFIMYVGRPLPHKNLDRLVAAFAVIKKSHPDLILVIAGKKDALYGKLENKVLQQGITDIYFTDYVSDGELRWLYENTKAYVFPSLSEGFGLPGLEAMAHGAPVVSSNATCLPEIYGGAAYYFDPKNTGDIAEKVSAVLDSKKLQQELQSAGYQQVKKYSWSKMAKQTLAIYKAAR